MTITEDFRRTIHPDCHKPAWCPAWCDAGSHEAHFASDFGVMTTPEEYATNLALFREHKHALPELPVTLTLMYPTAVPERQPTEMVRRGGHDFMVMVHSQPPLDLVRATHRLGAGAGRTRRCRLDLGRSAQPRGTAHPRRGMIELEGDER